MQRFSIIVPLLDDRRLFDDTLASVLRYRPAKSEIMVVHDGTYDDPFGLCGEVAFVSTERRSNLVDLFNAGVEAATGSIVAWIRPGIELANGWSEAVESRFEDTNVASVTPLIVSASHPQTIVAAGVKTGLGNNRSVVGARARIAPRTIRRISPMGPTTWAACYRRSALNQLETMAEQIDPHFLDVDVAMSLQQLGYCNELSPECVLTIERASLLQRESVLPHGRSAQRAYYRHAEKTDRSILKTISLILGETLMSSIQPWRLRHAFGRTTAWKMRRTDLDYADHLHIVASEQDELDSSETMTFPGVSDQGENRSARRAA